MKTIAIFSGYHLPHLGGIERYVDNLSKKLIDKGYRVIIVSSNYNNSIDFEENNSLINIRIPVYNIFKNRYPIPKKNNNYRRLIKKLDDYNIDRIIVNTRFHLTSHIGAKYGEKHSIPVYLIEHGSNYVTLNNKFIDFFANRYEDYLTWRIKKKITGFYGVSEAASKWLKKFKIQATGVWYNSIDKFDENIKIEKDNKNIYITYAGRILKEKGVEDLITVFLNLRNEYNNIELLLAGDGNYLTYLKQKYQDDSIHYLGNLGFNDLVNIYAKTNIFVHPSHYPEGLPTCILEAGLMKCAIVTTPNGGTKYFIDGNNGYVVESINELEEKMKVLISNSKLIKQFGDNIYDTVTHKFLWDVTVDKILNDMKLGE